MKAKSWDGWNGTDDFGFSALPGGYGSSYGGFSGVGYSGFWLSASEDISYSVWGRDMYIFNDVYRNSNRKLNLFSVRCLQDD